MKIRYFDLHENVHIDTMLTACIGYFDGLHLGHQKLIEEVCMLSERNATSPALITFEPDPWVILKHVTALPHLTTMKQRMQIGEKLGIKYWIILKFSEEMAALTYEQFHQEVLGKLHIHTLVCGFDFRYAVMGEGNIQTLQEQTICKISVISEVSSEHKKISSTRIEALIQEGKVEKAAQFMGRFYDMAGIVKSGNKVGGKHGFPTANLQLDDAYVIPHKGVYAGGVFVLGTWYQAIINIGNNPTYNYQEHVSIEAHLLDFHETIYGLPIIFRFCKFLRQEKKFRDIQELSLQLQQDEQTALAYFKGREELLLCD